MDDGCDEVLKNEDDKEEFFTEPSPKEPRLKSDAVRIEEKVKENDSSHASPTSVDNTDEDDNSNKYIFPEEETRALFLRGASYIKPSRFFRLIVNLYGDRKRFVFFWLHFVATMVIWGHFALVKWDEQKATVPEGAANYWWKRIAPTLEFGSMHAILFQMALIPLTMSRYSIAALSHYLVDRFIPLNRMLCIHIHLGNVVVHHGVFTLYLITIIHTFDDVERNDGRKRSQTFKWFSSTLLFYACDRLAMHLNQRYGTRVLTSVAVHSADDSRMLLVKIGRPALFQFKPGQYAFLKVPLIGDHQWHPSSIASCPSSNYLEFYIEMFGPESWTAQLWTLLGGDVGGVKADDVDIEVMGPYGTSLGATTGSHGLAIGAGTEIVPVSAMFQQNVRRVMRLSPDVHFRLVDEDLRRQTILSSFQEISACVLRDRAHSDTSPRTSKDLKRAAFQATESIYGVVCLGILTVYGTVVLSLSLSWNTIPIELYGGMTGVLQFLTWTFQALFAFAATFVWDGTQFLAYVDVVLCMVCVPADIFWFREYERNNGLGLSSTALLAMSLAYMTARLWLKAVGRRHTSWRHANGEACNGSLECVQVVWVTRSAPLISKVLPRINTLWDEIT
ncbi:hypothetical protein ACA910_012366 [Epithemia clementina (nom. ined.)]